MAIVDSFVCSAGTFTYDRYEETEWPTYFWKNGDKELVTDQRNAAVGNGCGNDSGAYDPEYEGEEGCIEITAVNTGEHQVVFFGWGVTDTGATYYDIYSGIAADNAYLNEDVFCQFLQPHDESIAPSGDVVRSVVPGVAYVKDNESVYYNPVPKYLVLTYNVTDISAPTHILNDWEGGMSFAEEIFVDGVKTELMPIGDVAMGYQFDSTGTHTVKIHIPDYLEALPNHLFSLISDGEDSWGNSVQSLVRAKIPFGIKDVGQSCFLACRNLTGVSLPEGIEYLNGTFEDTGLQNIKLPSTLTDLGRNTFYASKIKNITIPENVTGIGYNCFYGSDIEEIVIPDNVTSLGDSCFERSAIKNAVFGTGVTAVPSNCFFLCRGLTSVTLTDSITQIGGGAFYTTAIRNITLPTGLTILGGVGYDPGVFNNCYYLESIVIPSGVKKIENNTFNGCYSLASITLNEGLETISGAAFASCSSLTGLTLPSTITAITGSTTYRMLSGCYFKRENLVNNSSVPTPTRYWELRFIDEEREDGLLISGASVVGCRARAVSVTVPDGIDKIETNFSTCYNLTGITVPTSVTAITYGIKCDSLERFDGPFASTDGKMLISAGTAIAFAYHNIKNYSVPEGVVTIGPSLFQPAYQASGIVLETIVLPNSLERISDSAFSQCNTLKSVSFGNNLEYIGNYAFYNCDLNTVMLPNSLTGLGQGVFYSCDSLTTVVIPDSVTGELNRTFYKCRSLANCQIGTGITSLVNGTFYSCHALSSITLPNTITTIGDSVFGNCLSLTGVTFPSGVNELGSHCFEGCRSITAITLPTGMTKLPSYCFANCTSLTGLTIPTGVTSIESYCFSGPSSYSDSTPMAMTSLTIPDSVTGIGSNCFSRNNSIVNINFGTGVTKMSGSNIFDSCVSLISVDLPSSLTGALGSYMFNGCRSLTSVTIPAGVTSLNNYSVFSSCPNLETITCYATTAPTVRSGGQTFSYGIKENGVLRYPSGSDYSTWLSSDNLGKYGWTGQTI